jgi:hypothetical protein
MLASCKIKRGHSGPNTPAKFDNVYDRVEHGLCKTVTARKWDAGMEKISCSSVEVKASLFRTLRKSVEPLDDAVHVRPRHPVPHGKA